MYYVETIKKGDKPGYFHIYEWLRYDTATKFGDGAKVVRVEYSDYGGTFFDRALIEHYKANRPEDIECVETGYNGQMAYVRVSDDCTDGQAYEFDIYEFEDTYYGLEREMQKKEAKEYCEEHDCARLYDEVLEWLENNSNTEPNLIDYYAHDLDEYILPMMAGEMNDDLRKQVNALFVKNIRAEMEKYDRRRMIAEINDPAKGEAYAAALRIVDEILESV